MLQDAQGNFRFDPADVTIKTGDGVKFIPPERVIPRKARGPGMRWAA